MSKKVDLEITIPELKNCQIIQDLEKIKELVKVLEYIDQPLNASLNSILQITCQYSKNMSVISYLLEQGANPNYLDIEGKDALYYAQQNIDPVARQLCVDLLIPYVKSHIQQDPNIRKKQVWELIKSEIQRHRTEEEEQQKLLEEFLDKCKELEVNDGK